MEEEMNEVLPPGESVVNRRKQSPTIKREDDEVNITVNDFNNT